MTVNRTDLRAEIKDMLINKELNLLQRHMLIRAYLSNSIDEMYRIFDIIDEGVGE